MVAFGKAIVGVGPLPGRDGRVGVLEARRIVGAGAMVAGPTGLIGTVGVGLGPAVRRGIVGAGAGGRGAPPTVGVGGAIGTGGRTGGAAWMVAEGTAGGASAALRVTRTVSFLRGTLDVCLDGSGD
jgi:hypothetical protein